MTRHRVEIERALAFVAEHLDQPLTVADVARAARLSEFHFQRVFHEALDESVGQFVTRKRLETAALRLAYDPALSITEIALSSGYSSSSNFSKAFSSFFGCSPTALRAPSDQLPEIVGKLTARYGKDFRPTDLYTLDDDADAETLRQQVAYWNERVRYETSTGMDFACLASMEGYALDALEETWRDLIGRACQLRLCGEEVDAWGKVLDSPNLTAPERCRYHACVPCPSGTHLPEPLFSGRLDAGRYAVFRYAGPVHGVSAAYRSIYSCWFRASSVTPRDFEPLDHYVTDEPKDGEIEMFPCATRQAPCIVSCCGWRRGSPA